MKDLGPAAIAANIEHFETIRIKHTELALEALAQETKWRAQQEIKKDPEGTLKKLLTTMVD